MLPYGEITEYKRMTNANIAVLPGDGIGPEVMEQGLRVLHAAESRFGHQFNLQYGSVGGGAIDDFGTALPDDTLKTCKKSDAVLFGAVGGPKWDDPKAAVRPEQGLLALRKKLNLFANIRPVKVYPQLRDATPLKPENLDGVDMIVIRELTGGLYFGKPKRQWTTSRGRRAVDSMAYSEDEIRRIVRVGFEVARGRPRKKLTSVDKANVLESSRLWRQIVLEMAPSYPDVELDHLLVDTCAMHLVRQPARFDVIVTENTFGDILTDETAVLSGSMGMLPSASLNMEDGEGGAVGVYEPCHGSAPDIVGQNKANPSGMILSVAMMLRHSLGLEEEARTIETAVEQVLEEGYRTPDIAEDGTESTGTVEMGALIAEKVAG